MQLRQVLREEDVGVSSPIYGFRIVAKPSSFSAGVAFGLQPQAHFGAIAAHGHVLALQSVSQKQPRLSPAGAFSLSCPGAYKTKGWFL